MSTFDFDAIEFPNEYIKQLWLDLYSVFEESGNMPVAGEVDALEQSTNGNGVWGFLQGDDGEVGIWALADEGTFIAYQNGNTESIDYECSSDVIDKAASDNLYTQLYNLLTHHIPSEDMPDFIPVNDDETAGAELAGGIDVELDDDETDDVEE